MVIISKLGQVRLKCSGTLPVLSLNLMLPPVNVTVTPAAGDKFPVTVAVDDPSGMVR